MKKTLAIFLAAFFAVLMCVSASAIDLDTAEVAEIAASTDGEAALAEVTFTAVPGLNYFTGTEEPFDFENEEIAAAILAGMSMDVFDSKTIGEVPSTITRSQLYGKAMVFHRPVKKDWFHIKYNNFSFDGIRPYYYAMDTYYAFAGTPSNSWMAFVNAEAGSVHYTATTKPNAWATQSFKNKTPKNGWKVDLQVSMSEGGQNVASAYELTAYVDNMILVPYYKVIYYNADGSEELAHEYVLFDDSGFILKEYTPNNSIVDGVTGYSDTIGGERVGTVALKNQDVKLYAVDTDEASFVAGGKTANVAATTEEYTLPTPEALGLNVDNFRYWTDGTNDYFAGDKLDTGLVAGAVYKAVCFKPMLFDPVKGELVYFFDFEGAKNNTDPTYINVLYGTEFNPRTDGNTDDGFIKLYRDPVDGNTVMKLVNSLTNKYQLFGYGVKYNERTVGGKATVEYDFKYITPATEYAKGNVWVRMLNQKDNADVNYIRGAVTMPANRVEGNWYRAVVTSKDTSGNGWRGGIFQYENLPTDKHMIQYVDNYAFYVYPAKTFVFKNEKNAEEYTKVTAEGDTYIMPTSDVENAIAWTDGNNYYLIGETYNVADLEFKVLYPFCQSADMPAMISLYEEGGLVSNRADKFSYYENIDDDGRSVLHFHQWKKTWNDTHGWMNDARVFFYVPGDDGCFDASEYKTISIMIKKTSAYNATDVMDKNTTYKAVTSANTVLFNFVNASHSYDAKSRVGGFGTKVDGKYHNIEVNMADSTHINATYPWETTGYGFAIDPSTISYGGDTYIDYVRVYRNGIQTITYDVNLPEENAIFVNKDTFDTTDTNRGLGYGYLLKDERPVVEGYIFKGWATDKNSTKVVTSIDIDGNETVYAVWEKADTKAAPEMKDKDTVEIKGIGSNNGIRFKASIMSSVKANLNEFGFIATREVLLPYEDEENNTRDYNALTFLHRENGSKKEYFVSGTAYNADGTVDLINGDGDDGSIIYTTVLSGIPLANKKENMVVRSYAKYDINGNTMTVYGDAVVASLYDTALAVRTENGKAYENNKKYIDEILAETVNP